MNLAALLKSQPSLPALRDALAKVERQHDAAATKRDDLLRQRESIIVSGTDAAIQRHYDAVAAAEREIDRLSLQQAELARRMAAAEEAEAEEHRVARYAAAQKAAADAEKALKQYPTVAAQLVTLLERIATAEAAVEDANADLPAGAAALASPEMAVRGLPADQERVVAVEEVARWYFPSPAPSPVAADLVSRIETKDGRHGTLAIKSDGQMQRFRVVKRTMRRTTYLPDRPAYGPPPLAASIELPELLPGQGPFWSPNGSAQLGSGESDAEAVLAAARDLRAQWNVAPTDPRAPRNTATRFDLLPEAQAEGGKAA